MNDKPCDTEDERLTLIPAKGDPKSNVLPFTNKSVLDFDAENLKRLLQWAPHDRKEP